MRNGTNGVLEESRTQHGKYVSPKGAVAGSVPWEGSDRNPRTVWTIPVQGYSGAHFATFPKDLIKPCILAGCPVGGTVLEPFLGSGTTAEVARKNGCHCIGIELNPEYHKLIKRRLQQLTMSLSE
jgi:DNA modification methylase